MHGPDRKTPIDGVPEAPEITAHPGDPDDPSAQRTSADGGDSADVDRRDRREAPAISTPLSATPAPQEGSRSEAETPQTASISATGPQTARAIGRAGRRGSSWAHIASYLGQGGPVGRLRNATGVRKAIAVAGGVAAILSAILLPRVFGQSDAAAPLQVRAVSLAGGVSGLGGVVDGGGLFADPRSSAADAAAADAAQQDAAVRSGVWRVAQLGDDPSVALVELVPARRPLAATLAGTRVPPAEGQRLIASLGDVHSVDHFGPKDALTVAVDKATGHVVAYELTASPADVWQGRDEPQPDGSPKLLAKKLRLEIERVRVRKAVLVGADLHASFVDAGLAPIDDLLAMLDDALDGHAELSDVRPGARLRIVATQDQVDGAFIRWVSLEAVEYLPATPSAPSVRVYRFGEDDEGPEKSGAGVSGGVGGHGADTKKRRGWYDARGRQPFHGGWRTPVPLARITSRFNPHRMHPVLHIVMPHTGVDFAAPVGTPVYATAAGVVTSVGKDGPCGNRVEIAHPGNITSVYCHLSRFAAGLHAGLHVEQRQLIAYVGQTGRVTGPHLHFGIRRAGVVIDPMTLRLDGMRVVPRPQRDEFDRRRAELDAELDGVALPATGGVSVEAPEPGDSFYEEP